jgi:hypothetical protein
MMLSALSDRKPIHVRAEGIAGARHFAKIACLRNPRHPSVLRNCVGQNGVYFAKPWPPAKFPPGTFTTPRTSACLAVRMFPSRQMFHLT